MTQRLPGVPVIPEGGCPAEDRHRFQVPVTRGAMAAGLGTDPASGETAKSGQATMSGTTATPGTATSGKTARSGKTSGNTVESDNGATPGGAAVAGIALHCPDCDPRTPVDELREIVAAWRRTLAGLDQLSDPVRATLASSGALAGLYRGTLEDLSETAERCRVQLGVEPPAALRRERQERQEGLPPRGGHERHESQDDSLRRQAIAALEAASAWLAQLPPSPS